MKRQVDVLALGPPVFDQDIPNTLGIFAPACVPPRS
jgi:hypothetical protein